MSNIRVLELSDDMLDQVAGGAGQTVDEARQSLLRLEALAEQYKAAQDSDRKDKADSGSTGQDAVQNAMLQGLLNSQMGTTQTR